jgi:DNA polymerase
MQAITLTSLNDFGEWRRLARRLLLAAMPPEGVVWFEPGTTAGLFDDHDHLVPVDNRAVGTVPKRFIELGEKAIQHRDTERFALLYRLLWRLQRFPDLLQNRSDPDVGKLDRRVAAVERDAHRMLSSARFRSVIGDDGVERFLAWYAPEHYTLEATAPLFLRRFRGSSWGIVTPYRSAFGAGGALSFGPGQHQGEFPAEDAADEAWIAYYAAASDPSRLSPAPLTAAHAVKSGRNPPDAPDIASPWWGGKAPEVNMIERQTTPLPAPAARRPERISAPGTPEERPRSLTAAREAAAACTRCPLFELATQTVFGEGPARARLMFVGEQPGDQEDLAGHPFVGPAGQVFDAALAAVGIERGDVYVTNAVKHFKFEPRGKRRIHQKPNAGEISACRFWLDLERAFVRPQLIVAMGATAVASLVGRGGSITRLRGRPHTLEDGTALWVTVHPSYLLRMPDRAQAAIERRRFEDDLRAIRAYVEALPAATETASARR